MEMSLNAVVIVISVRMIVSLSMIWVAFFEKKRHEVDGKRRNER